MIDPEPRGALWLATYSRSGGTVVKKIDLEGFPDSSHFHPLGIDVISDPSTEGGFKLFVINHGPHNATIEIFSLSSPDTVYHDGHNTNPITIVHLATLTHPAFLSPNSLVLVSPTSFLVTNDHRWPTRLRGAALSRFETFSKFPGGWVDLVEFESEGNNDAGVVVTKVTRMTPSISFANGIALSPDGKTIALASSVEDTIRFFHWDLPSRTLELYATVPIPYHPDNLDYTEDGVLYVAGTPHFPTLIKVAKGQLPSVVKAGSWASAVTPVVVVEHLDGTTTTTAFKQPLLLGADPAEELDGGSAAAPFSDPRRAVKVKTHDVRTVYQSDGSPPGYGTSSGAVVDAAMGVVFIVGLYERGMLQCTSRTSSTSPAR